MPCQFACRNLFLNREACDHMQSILRATVKKIGIEGAYWVYNV